MLRVLIISLIVLLAFNFCNPCQRNISNRQILADSILKLDMSLSAFGVESDSFPSIDAYIDFVIDSSYCTKSYYNPVIKGSTYHLSEIEIKKILILLEKADLVKLKSEYTIGATDQPTSTTIIYTNKRKFVFKDYGLQGEYPLKELYKIVYKF